MNSTNAASKFTAKIEMKDDAPVVMLSIGTEADGDGKSPHFVSDW